MKVRPIILNADMVRAVLNGSKTQTRRIIKPQPFDRSWAGHDHQIEIASGRAENGDEIDGLLAYTKSSGGEWHAFCPFGQPGDRLWVREAFAAFDADWCFPGRPHDLKDGPWPNIIYPADGGKELPKGSCRPSIHMPRWASRIALEITGVRVEPLASVSTGDARAEGYPAERAADGGPLDAWLWFRDLWDGIYPEQSFKVNPWVWVIEFQRVDGEK